MTIDNDAQIYEQLVAQRRNGSSVPSFTRGVLLSNYGSLDWKRAAVDSSHLCGLLGSCAAAGNEPRIMADPGLRMALFEMLQRGAMSSSLAQRSVDDATSRLLGVSKSVNDVLKLVASGEASGDTPSYLEHMGRTVSDCAHAFEQVHRADVQLLDVFNGVCKSANRAIGREDSLSNKVAPSADINANEAADRLRRLMDDDCKLFAKAAKALPVAPDAHPVELQHVGSQLIEAHTRAIAASFAQVLSPSISTAAGAAARADSACHAAEVTLPALGLLRALLEGYVGKSDSKKVLAYIETVLQHTLASTAWGDATNLQTELQKTLELTRSASSQGQLPEVSSQEAAALRTSAETCVARAVKLLAASWCRPGTDLDTIPVTVGPELPAATDGLEVHTALDMAQVQGKLLSKATASSTDRVTMLNKRQAEADAAAQRKIGDAKRAVQEGKTFDALPATLEACIAIAAAREQRNTKIFKALLLIATLIDDVLCRSAIELARSSSDDGLVQLCGTSLFDFRRQQLIASTVTIGAYVGVITDFLRGYLEIDSRYGRESSMLLERCSQELVHSDPREGGGGRAQHLLLQLLDCCERVASEAARSSSKREEQTVSQGEERRKEAEQLVRVFEGRPLKASIAEAIDEGAKLATTASTAA